MKGGGAGLAAIALSYYFLVDDVRATMEKGSPCGNWIEALKLNSERKRCSRSQIRRLGEACSTDIFERAASNLGGAAAIRAKQAIDKLVDDAVVACNAYNRRKCEEERAAREQECAAR